MINFWLNFELAFLINIDFPLFSSYSLEIGDNRCTIFPITLTIYTKYKRVHLGEFYRYNIVLTLVIKRPHLNIYCIGSLSK